MLLSATQALVPGEFATLVLAADGADGVETRLVADQKRAIATGARLQVIHGSPQAGVLDVYLLDVDQDPATTQPRYQLPTLFIEVDTMIAARDYDVLVAFSGTLEAVAPRATLAMPEDSIHTVLVGDPATQGGDFVLLVQDDTPTQ